MATTFTYTPAWNQPKSPHTGLQTVAVDWLIGGTNKFGSISDVALLAKIPNGAVVVDWKFNFTTLAESQVMSLVLLAVESGGTYSVYATLDSTLTSSATAAIQSTGYRPIKVSLSDDRAVQYVALALNVTAGTSGTVSFSTYGNLSYLADSSSLS
jgi:hypothetical protein